MLKKINKIYLPLIGINVGLFIFSATIGALDMMLLNIFSIICLAIGYEINQRL